MILCRGLRIERIGDWYWRGIKKPISRLSDEQSNHKQCVAIQCRPGLRYRSSSWGTQVAYIILQSEKHTIPYWIVRIVSSCSTSALVFPMHGTTKGFQNFCDATVHCTFRCWTIRWVVSPIVHFLRHSINTYHIMPLPILDDS